MNSITALMLSRAIEEDRRREIERRPHRLMTAEPMGRPSTERRRWTLSLRGLGLAGSSV